MSLERPITSGSNEPPRATIRIPSAVLIILGVGRKKRLDVICVLAQLVSYETDIKISLEVKIATIGTRANRVHYMPLLQS